ncbi:hypothetical protein ACFL6E_02790 [Candidatus Neomarinimicrobiota bacterium]
MTSLHDYHITHATDNICEGEVALITDNDVDSTLIEFARALIDAVIRDGSGMPKLSSFTFERLKLEVTGVVYGQAYLERRGNTLHHLKYKILDSSGVPVASGMSTTHLKQVVVYQTI